MLGLTGASLPPRSEEQPRGPAPDGRGRGGGMAGAWSSWVLARWAMVWMDRLAEETSVWWSPAWEAPGPHGHQPRGCRLDPAPGRRHPTGRTQVAGGQGGPWSSRTPAPRLPAQLDPGPDSPWPNGCRHGWTTEQLDARPAMPTLLDAGPEGPQPRGPPTWTDPGPGGHRLEPAPAPLAQQPLPVATIKSVPGQQLWAVLGEPGGN